EPAARPASADRADTRKTGRSSGQRLRSGSAPTATATGAASQPRGTHAPSAAIAVTSTASQQCRSARHAVVQRTLQLKAIYARELHDLGTGPGQGTAALGAVTARARLPFHHPH